MAAIVLCVTMKKNLPYMTAVLCCCGLAMAGLSFGANCVGLFFMPIANSLGVGLGEVSLYLTINNLATGFSGVLAVRLCRKYDMRRVLGVCMILSFGTYFCLSRATATWQLYLLAAANGTLNAFYGMAMVSVVIGNWFYKNMGLASGFAFSFSGLASSVLTMILNGLIQNHSWRTAYLFIAVMMVVSILPSVLLLHFSPKQAGLLPYGQTEEMQPAPAKEKPDGRVKVAHFPLLCLILIFTTAITGMCTQFAGFGSSIGLNTTVAALLVSATMVGNTASKICMGVLCDRLGAKWAMHIILGATTLGLLAIFALAGTQNVMILLPAAVCAGMSFSICGVGMSNMAKEVYGAKTFAAIYPTLSLYICIGGAAAHAIIGFSFDLFGSYYPMLGLCIVFGLVCMALVQYIYTKEKR